MPPPYTLEDLMDAASRVFRSTTGPSPRIVRHYQNLSPDFLARPMTADNVAEFVRLENRALLSSGTPATPLDRIAIAATPLRGVAAHFAAQHATIGRHGFLADNEYSREAFSGIVSGNS